jgi:hypothetical protein
MTALARYRYSNWRCEVPSFRSSVSPGGDRRRPAIRRTEQGLAGTNRSDPRVPLAAKRQWPGYSNLIWDVALKLMFGPIDPPDTRWIKLESGVISWYW